MHKNIDLYIKRDQIIKRSERRGFKFLNLKHKKNFILCIEVIKKEKYYKKGYKFSITYLLKLLKKKKLKILISI